MITDLEAVVLSPEFEPISPINQMTALTWTERFHEVGGFSLYCPLTPENARLFVPENLIWIGTDTVGVVETIQKKKAEDGSLTLEISGRFIECWLDRRIVWDIYSKTENVSTYMRNIVNENVISPTIAARKIPHIALATSQVVLGASISKQVHRDNLWETLEELGKAHNLSPRFSVSVPERTAYFVVRAGTDRSLEQNNVPAIVLSSELSDILTSDYALDYTAMRNTTRVAGAGEGAERKEVTVLPEITGLERRELSVDARDLQDTVQWKLNKTTVTTVLETETNDAGTVNKWLVQKVVTKVLKHPDTGQTKTTTTTTKEWVATKPIEGTQVKEGQEAVAIDPTVYQNMLIERGKAKATENVKVETFNSQIRMQGVRAYTFGEDYFLGDRITVQDTDLNIQISTEVTEIEKAWDEQGYSVTLTLGNAAPTIKQLILKKG